MFVALGRPQHERLEPGVEHEGRDGVDELHFQQLNGRHFGHEEAPRIPVAQIDLLQVLVEPAHGTQRLLGGEFLGQKRHLGQRSGVGQTNCLRGGKARSPAFRRLGPRSA